MLELARELLPLLQRGQTVATITVVSVAHSAPRGVGSAMAVTSAACVIGSISGGCVEADAVALALASLSSRRSNHGRAATFGFSDEQAFAAGLACGGSIDAVISIIRPTDTTAIDALERAARGEDTSIGLVTSGAHTGQLINPHEHTDAEVLLVRERPQPRLILIGASEHAAALCRVGSAAGFAVTVCDIWPLLVTAERFPDAVELVADDPRNYLRVQPQFDERSAICILSHDVRIDVPSIALSLRSGAGFVGALGARSTVAHRRDLLRNTEDVTEDELSRLHSPLGLDLGGASPEHTAIAALAEIIATQFGGTGAPLRARSGPLHARAGMPHAPGSSCTIRQENAVWT